MPGDITEDGYLSEWESFVARYGLDGTDANLHYPVFEGYGNHDIHSQRATVKNGIRARHKALHYSLDVGGVHFANCNLFPGDTDEAEYSLTWLKTDLANRVGASERAVLIFMHYDLLPQTGTIWWTEDERSAFARAIAGYNVVAIFHGHLHNTSHYSWQGYDVYNVGAAKTTDSESFAVVHITDTRFEAANYRWTPGDLTGSGKWTGWAHSKSIRTGPPPLKVRDWALYE